MINIPSRDHIHYSIYYYTLLATAVTLPYSIQINSICLVILLLNWLAEGNFKLKWQKAKASAFVGMHIMFYLLHVVGLIHTNNLIDGTFDLEVKATIFLLPALIYSSSKLTTNHSKNILKAFVFSVLVATVICLIYATYRNYQEGYTLGYLFRSVFIDKVDPETHTYLNYWYFSYNLLSSAIKLHPIYFAMYAGFCCLIAFNLYLTNRNHHTRNYYLYIVLIVYFLIFILMLSARIQILIMLGMIIGIVIYYSLKKNILIKGILIIAGFIVLFMGVIYINPLNRERFKEVFDFSSDYKENHWGGRSLRLYKWKYTMEVISKNFIIGVGSGDTQDELQKEYSLNNFEIGYEGRFNAHNQYLQSALGLGIIGFAALILLLWGSIKIALAQENYLFLGFVLLFYLSCLTESMLCTQKGVVFYSFFASILSAYPKLIKL